MFTSIVWATDGSESADGALVFAKALAARDSATLTIVHCDEFLIGRGGGQPVVPDEADVKAQIGRQLEQLKRDGLDVELKVVSVSIGGVAHRIVEVAAEIQADVIVVGTRGHTALGGLLLGSITQRLLHLATCPVFVVPVGASQSEAKAEQATATVAG